MASDLHSSWCGKGVRGASALGPAPPPWSPVPLMSQVAHECHLAMSDQTAAGEGGWDPPSVPTSPGAQRANLTIAGTETFVGLGKPIWGKGPLQ